MARPAAAGAGAATVPAIPARPPTKPLPRHPLEPPPAERTGAGLPRVITAILVLLILIGLGTAVALIVHDRSSKSTTATPSTASSPKPSSAPAAAGAASPTPQATASAQVPGVDFGAIAAAANPVVVSLSVTRSEGTVGATGIVLNSSGAVLTNDHVVEHALTISARVGTVTYLASVLGDDDSADVALLQLQGASGLQTPKIGDAASLAVGDPVVAVASGPLQVTPTAFAATVTAVNQTMPAIDPDAPSPTLPGVIQLSVPLRSRASGGPLLDTRGEIVGMNLAPLPTPGSPPFAPPTGTVGYALPINRALASVQQIQLGHAK